MRQLEGPAAIYLISFQKSNGTGFIKAHPWLLNKVLDLSLGGDGTSGANAVERPLTQIDLAIYRWGLIIGFFGGGLLGLALYVINFYSLSYFFPWFYAYRSWVMVVSHIVFGALAGGLYELLEVEEYVMDDR